MPKFFKVFSLVAIALVFFSGGVAAYESSKASVIIVDGNEGKAYRTAKSTVGELLNAEGINIDAGDEINKGLSDSINEGDKITIKRANAVTVYIDSVPKHVKTTKNSVGELLGELDNNVDYVLLDADHKDLIEDDMEIYVGSKREKHFTQTESVPYETETKYNPELLKGTENVISEGTDGEKEILFKEIYISDVKTDTVKVSESIVTKPVNKIIEIGTKEETVIKEGASVQAEDLSYTKVMTMNASAYSRFEKGLSDRTATPGIRAEKGVVAVDPGVIPLGTRVYVEGYGHAIAADTGGAIKGNKIDLCFDSLAEVNRFGRRNVKVYILD